MSKFPLHRPRPGLPLRWLLMLALAALVFAGGAFAAPIQPAPVLPGLSVSAPNAAQIGRGSAATVAPRIERALLGGGKQDFTIELRDKADLSAAPSLPWNARGRHVVERLQATAEQSQPRVRDLLARRGLTFHSYWINNSIIVEDGDLADLRAITAVPGIARIGDVPKMDLIKPSPGHAPTAKGTDDPTLAPNIAWIGADQAWADGTTGDGIVVGIIDDGVSYTHEALRRQYRGTQPNGGAVHDYNWRSPIGSDPEPRSVIGHGTHVTGTVVGDNGADGDARRRTGVAPGAKWIGCLGLPMDGSEFALPECGQFMLAPTTVTGDNPNPDLRPHVVNNSWGRTMQCDGTADDFYRAIVDAWVAAGIFPVFSAGNSSGCGLTEPAGLSTVSSPAALPAAFAVGSTGNHDGQYAVHSLWGPSAESSPGLPTLPDHRGYPTMKPQVVAPGVDIVSTMGETSDYEPMTGTSMSAPHITGLVALMLQAGECLIGDYATVGTMLMQTARPIDYASGGTPPPGPNNLPNYATGWGEIDAPAAVAAAAAACGDQGFLRGTVTDMRGAPIQGATVEVFVDANVRIYQTTTDAAGNYVRRLPVLGAPGYTVRASRYGFLPNTEAGVLIGDAATTRHDIQLADAAIHKISGRVTDASTGWPLHAYVAVGGRPEASVWTDPATGTYSVRLAEGNAYRFDVHSDVPGYLPQSRDLPALAGGGTQDFALDADLVTCAAPGYAYAGTLLQEGFDTGTLPSGWNATSLGHGWQFGNTLDLWTPGVRITDHGPIAIVNEELAPVDPWENDDSDDNLLLPAQNLAGSTNPVLRYASFLYANEGLTRVEASTDGGATWSVLSRPTPVDYLAPWRQESVSLAGLAVDDLRLRFHSNDGSSPGDQRYGIAWAIDDVQVVTGCTPPADGGLVLGHVRDANTGAPLNGALVNVAGGGQAISGSSIDGNIGDGAFAVYAPAGNAVLAATPGTLPTGYGSASLNIVVPDGGNVTGNLALPAGRLRVLPLRPSVTVELGQTASTQFTTSNTGTLALNYGLERTAVEEHFDATTFPPPGWTVTNATDGCGWTGLDPREFSNYAAGDGRAAYVDPYPCWDGSDTDTVLLAPPLDLSTSHTASAGFFMALLEGADAYPIFDVDASGDGGQTWTTVFTERFENNGTGPGALIELDLSAFVGNSDVRVRFRYRQTPPWGWVIIDQIHLFDAASMSPMLDLSIDHGTLATGQSHVIDLDFDAGTVNQPGTYAELINVVEDTPYALPLGTVETEMTVTPPASFGALRGIVRSLGTCDASPTTLAGVTVTVTDANGGTQSVTSAEDGGFTWWADAATGPFTVAATHAGHAATSRVLPLTAGTDTIADLDLRPLQPCLRSNPSPLAASAAVGATTDLAFALQNLGAGATDWTLRPGGDPDVLSPVALQQTTGRNVLDGYGFACYQPSSNFTTRNHWLRVFPPAPGTASPRERLVTALNLGVMMATSQQGSQPVIVRVHTLDGDLSFANLTLLGEQQIDVADTQVEVRRVVFDEPLRTTADATLVAEIEIPTGLTEGNGFFPGGNDAGETAPSYWASIDCGEPEPRPTSEVGFGWIHLVLDLETQASDACGAETPAVPWLTVSNDAGTLAGDASETLQASFDASQLGHGRYNGALCITPGAAGGTEEVPVTFAVSGGDDVIFADGFE